MVLRALVYKEDKELKLAYDRFHKLVLQEHGVVRNAILTGIEGLKAESSLLQSNVKENLSLTRDISGDAKLMQKNTEYSRQAIEGKVLVSICSTTSLRSDDGSSPSPLPPLPLKTFIYSTAYPSGVHAMASD